MVRDTTLPRRLPSHARGNMALPPTQSLRTGRVDRGRRLVRPGLCRDRRHRCDAGTVDDSRPGAEHRADRAHLWLHGVRHLARHGRGVPSAAADGRIQRVARQDDLHADPARRPEVAQRDRGDGRRLRGLAAAVGQARRRGQNLHAARRLPGGDLRQSHRHHAGEALRPSPRAPGQALPPSHPS